MYRAGGCGGGRRQPIDLRARRALFGRNEVSFRMQLWVRLFLLPPAAGL
jgi:hypothetical protein